MCYLHETTTKMKACHEHRKTQQERLIGQEKSCGNLSQISNKNWNRLKQKIKKFCRYDRTEVVIFLAEQEHAPFYNGGAIPLRIVLRLLTMFAPNSFGLSRCWVSNKDDSSVGRNFPRVISKCLLE